jgi:hypothetical protein
MGILPIIDQKTDILWEIFWNFPVSKAGNIDDNLASESKGGHDLFEMRLDAPPYIDTWGYFELKGVARHYSKDTIGKFGDNINGWHFQYITPDGERTSGGNFGRGDEPDFWAKTPVGGEAIHTLTVYWCYCGDTRILSYGVSPPK